LCSRQSYYTLFYWICGLFYDKILTDSGYYVKVKSQNLKKKLFEIILKDYDNIILHSKNETILKMLIEENAFTFEERKSLIDSYVNQKY